MVLTVLGYSISALIIVLTIGLCFELIKQFLNIGVEKGKDEKEDEDY